MSVNDLTDGDLVIKTRGGDPQAYGTLVARYQGHVYGLAYSLVGNWADAQDIAQETFIRAYANLGQLREPARFPAWLRRVAFSVTINWLQAFRPETFAELNGRVDLDGLEIPDFRPGPPETAEKRDLANAVLEAVASLPPKYRVPLTMFHLDGLSYRKVADFLDVPMGTVKSLIHRARQHLKPALSTFAAEEVSTMVKEVFEEHKLPEEFARKVLDGVPDLSYRKHESALEGSVFACMEYLEEPVPYEFLMGVSGSAFKLLWCLPAGCSSNNSMGILGPEPVRRVFAALGFGYELLARTDRGEDEEALWRGKIVESVGRGRPVIAWGIVGAPDEGVVAGYDQGGEVLLGRSYFYDDADSYYRKDGWYGGCFGVILIGEKTEAPSRPEILRDALEWAVQLACTPRSEDLPGADGRRATGLAAYNAWVAALGRDEDFPSEDLEELTLRCNIHVSVTLSGLLDARRSAAAFLRRMTDVAGTAGGELLAAAKAYDDEVRVLDEAISDAPFCFSPEEKRREIVSPALRTRLAHAVRAAKAEDEKAVGHLKRALAALTTAG
jgi:RNA polymerase sigma-70 factor (ECF subfamily)